MNTQEPTCPDFDKEGGLVPAIAQDARTGEILMLAWMNKEAWQLTTQTKTAVYWSRSRKRLWKKGEISGQIQKIKEIYLDCDNDAVLLKVEQTGQAACHTGRRSCFFQKWEDGKTSVVSKPLFNPQTVYKKSE